MDHLEDPWHVVCRVIARVDGIPGRRVVQDDNDQHSDGGNQPQEAGGGEPGTDGLDRGGSEHGLNSPVRVGCAHIEAGSGVAWEVGLAGKGGRELPCEHGSDDETRQY